MGTETWALLSRNNQKTGKEESAEAENQSQRSRESEHGRTRAGFIGRQQGLKLTRPEQCSNHVTAILDLESNKQQWSQTVPF